MRQVIAWTALIGFGAIWGCTIPLTKIAVSSGHGALGLVFWQLVIGALVLGIFLVWRGWRPVFSRELLFFFTVIAILGTIVPNGFSYVAAVHLPAGVMSIAIATVPMFTLVLALGIRLESLSLRRVSGVLIGFAGMVLIAAPDTSLPDPEKAVFVLVALIAPLFYGAEANFIALKTPSGTDPVSTLFMASMCGMMMAAPLAWFSGQWVDATQPWAMPEYALIASAVIHALTYCGYIWLVGFGGPVFSVQMAYPVTLSGVFASMAILGESYSAWIWAALVLVIFGIAMVQPKLEELGEMETGKQDE